MLVRIHWYKPALLAFPGWYVLAPLLASLLALSAVLAFNITLWTLAVDLRWTSLFFFSPGPLSHWLFWLSCSAAFISSAWLLDRYSRAADPGRSIELPFDC